MKTNTTLITTCLNEEKAIEGFLQSVFEQTVLPDEIIIVDGGSTDRTVASIKYYVSSITQGERIKIIKKKGNRSVGRNEAIKHAKNEIILCSDVGCLLDKDWVKNITKHFNDGKIDVVSGFYKPITHSVFEKCLAAYTCVMPNKVDPVNFLPSARSVAFRKSVWKEVGGYPENLDTCEDLIFDKNLKEKGFRFVFEKTAFVFWPQRKNLWEAVKQFYSYAKGDGQAHYFRKQTPILFARYALVIVLFVLCLHFQLYAIRYVLYAAFSVYILWSIEKNYRYIQNVQALLYLPLLQLSADMAVLFGTTIGYLSSISYAKRWKK